MTRQSTVSESHLEATLAYVIAGALIAAGVGAFLWVLVARRLAAGMDPLAEVDRRINELEASLHRVQATFEQTGAA